MKQNNNINPKETREQKATITPEELENLTKGTTEEVVANQTPLDETTSKEQGSSKREPEEDDSDTARERYYEEETSRPVATAGKATIVTLIVVILVLLLLLLCNNARKTGGDTTTASDNNGGNIVTTVGGNKGDNPIGTTSSSNNNVNTPKFDMDAFIASVESAVRNNGAGEIAIADASNCVSKLEADELKELIDKYGELKVQKAFANTFSYAIDIRANQYAESNGLTCNPNAISDWCDLLDKITEEYRKATGKNAEGTVMCLEIDGITYDMVKNSREAIKALIIKSGDKDLLTWYEKKTSSWDEACKAQKDTEAVEAFKESARLELLSATPTNLIKFIEFQLEQNINGTGSEYGNLIRDYGYLIFGNI